MRASNQSAPLIDDNTYVVERQALFQAELEQSKLFDKAVLTYSSGALGISLTFIHDIVPSFDHNTLPWLTTGWALLGTCLLLTVISFQTSQLSIRRQRAILDLLRTGKDAFSQKNGYAKLTNYLNLAAGCLFVVGVVCLVVFVRLNIEGA